MMNVEIHGFEISFGKIIPIHEIIGEVAAMWNIPSTSFDDMSAIQLESAEVLYHCVIGTGEQPLFVSFIFNRPLLQSPLFELETGLLLSKKWNTKVIITDMSLDDYFLQISPDGTIQRCEEGEGQNDETTYSVVREENLDMNQLKQNILDKAEREK